MALKIGTFNCNSIRARLPIVLDWLKSEKPDVLALQETKVTDDQFPLEDFRRAGWQVVFVGQKSYNGVAFVSRKPLANVRRGMQEAGDPEARFISAVCDGVLLINTYIPQGFEYASPKFQKKLKFYSDLKKHFSEHVTPATPALWMGDLNVAPEEADLWDPKRNMEHVCFHPEARAALTETCGQLWVDLFREKNKEPGQYTYWDYMVKSNVEKNRGWRIDHMLGTPPMVSRLKNIWIDKAPRQLIRPSDHTFLISTFAD